MNTTNINKIFSQEEFYWLEENDKLYKVMAKTGERIDFVQEVMKLQKDLGPKGFYELQREELKSLGYELPPYEETYYIWEENDGTRYKVFFESGEKIKI